MNKLVNVLLVVAIGVFLYFLAPILTPFLVGALLAYLLDPLVRWLMRWRFPRLLAVVTVFLLLVLIVSVSVLLLFPLIQDQIVKLIAAVPTVVTWAQNTVIPVLKTHFGIEDSIDVNLLKTNLSGNWASAGGMVSWLIKTILHSGFAIVDTLIHLLLIPVVMFYLLYDWDNVLKGLRNLLPRRYEPTIVSLASDCDAVLSAFFRGQLLVMLSLGIIYSVGLSLLGLQFGLMIGVLVGLLSIVPYLGVIIGIVTASVAAYMQFGDFSDVLMVWLLFAVGQLCEGMFLTPRLVGHRIGLHPVAVIFAVLTGGTLFGFFGVLLALPVAAVIMVVLRFLFQYYRNSPIYQ